MAIRFNLKITLVHRGILLGTGPLVDPGYEGTLLIPLHNLTSNTYQFFAGQEFVWVEFTKISDHPVWRGERESYDREIPDYVEFKESKKWQKPHDFLTKAYPSAIRSSIPDIHQQVQAEAKQARWLSSAALITVIVLILTALMLAYQLVSGAADRMDKLEQRIHILEQSQNISAAKDGNESEPQVQVSSTSEAAP